MRQSIGSSWRSYRAYLGPLVLCLIPLSWACSGLEKPPQSPVPCSRIALTPPPPWTAAASWDRSGENLILIDPGSKALVTYGRDGRQLETIDLEDTGLDFSRPMRLEPTKSGYVVLSQNLLVELDHSLAIQGHSSPFENLDKEIIPAASINDAILRRGNLVGHLDLVDARVEKPGDPGAQGALRSGFGRLNLASGKWRLLHEFSPSNDGEYASYYLSDRRPYVTSTEKHVYVLRFGPPWSVSRVGSRSLVSFAEGPAIDGEYAHSLQNWRGSLYVLSSQVLSETKASEETAKPTLDSSKAAKRARIELKQAIPSLQVGERRWMLTEIDQRRGKITQRFELPTRAERIRLVPGAAFWTAIEEGAGLDLGQEEGQTSFLFLPADEIIAGQFDCR